MALTTAVVTVPSGLAQEERAVPADAVADATGAKDGRYVVVLADDPVATYDGSIAGYAATAPEEGEQLDAASPAATRYQALLERRSDAALRRAGAAPGAKMAQLGTALAGFTAELDGAQAQALEADRRVLAVVPNEMRTLLTDTTPDFLGLTDRGSGLDRGLWARRGLFGEDVVVGVIDSGIHPGPSFADTGYDPLPGWAGACETGEEWSEDDCNDKLVGARFYTDGYFGEDATPGDVAEEFPEEFFSPRDADGHGTHTASTAAGNRGVTTPYGEISGMAPRARVAAYKVCWGYEGGGGCSTVDSVTAIDEAVADGVDVINYSISGTTTSFVDPVALAFLFAADAGVVVNASAGNDGPAASTVNHPSPWITTVAAGTETQSFFGEVTLGAGPGDADDDGDDTACMSTPVTEGLDSRSDEYVATATGVVDGKLALAVTRTAAGDETVRVRNGDTGGFPRRVELEQDGTTAFIVDAAAGDRVVVQEATSSGWVDVAAFDATDCATEDGSDDGAASGSFEEYDVTASCIADGRTSVEVTRTASGPEDVRVVTGDSTSDVVELDLGGSTTFVVDAVDGDTVTVEELRSGRWQAQGAVVVADCATDGGGDDGEPGTPGDDVEPGPTFTGAPSIGSEGTDWLPLVDAATAAAEGVSTEDAALCFADTLDPEVVEGHMVLCDRGVVARTAKSAEVARAGGVAMILGNTDDNSLNSDAHVVPTIHVDDEANAAITEYVATTDDPRGNLSPAQVVDAVAPNVAAFSARGPSAATGDLLKPDILAPGVDILAAYSPTIGGRSFDYLSGTSMSSPHMAGLSALIKEAHPEWSAAAIKSSLMTTAYQTRTDGTPIDGGPLAYGSGHVDPNLAWSPGLVYDAGFLDYLGFVCGEGQLATSTCDTFGAEVLDPSDLNQPNIAVGELAGRQTVTRTVTNTESRRRTYRPQVTAPEGVDVDVSPRRLRVGPRASAEYTVTFTVRDDAVLGEPTFGELTWAAGRREVTSQLAVTPTQLAAPDQVNGAGVQGEATWEIGFGYGGEFTAAAHGMVPATEQQASVADDPANDINVALGTGVGITEMTVEVPEGAAHTRIALFDAYTDGEDDLDLYVFGPDDALVGASGAGTSEEQVDLPFPAAGTYTVIVHGWETDGPDAQFTLFDWTVLADPSSDDGSLEVTAPDAAELGTTADVTASWSGLEDGTKHLGAVSYSDAEGVFGLTLVAVATDDGAGDGG